MRLRWSKRTVLVSGDLIYSHEGHSDAFNIREYKGFVGYEADVRLVKLTKDGFVIEKIILVLQQEVNGEWIDIPVVEEKDEHLQ